MRALQKSRVVAFAFGDVQVFVVGTAYAWSRPGVAAGLGGTGVVAGSEKADGAEIAGHLILGNYLTVQPMTLSPTPRERTKLFFID